MGRLSPASRKVFCNCNGTKGSGTYKVEGQFLELTSDIGTFRAQVGLMEHRRLATKLLRNVCTKAAEKAAQMAERGEDHIKAKLEKATQDQELSPPVSPFIAAAAQRVKPGMIEPAT